MPCTRRTADRISQGPLCARRAAPRESDRRAGPGGNAFDPTSVRPGPGTIEPKEHTLGSLVTCFEPWFCAGSYDIYIAHTGPKTGGCTVLTSRAVCRISRAAISVTKSQQSPFFVRISPSTSPFRTSRVGSPDVTYQRNPVVQTTKDLATYLLLVVNPPSSDQPIDTAKLLTNTRQIASPYIVYTLLKGFHILPPRVAKNSGTLSPPNSLA